MSHFGKLIENPIINASNVLQSLLAMLNKVMMVRIDTFCDPFIQKISKNVFRKWTFNNKILANFVPYALLLIVD